MATQLSNKFRYLLSQKVLDFSNDTFKIILMQSGFTFSKSAHAGYADVSSSELATGNGYTAGGATLSGVSVVQNDTANKCNITWNSATWTASSGDIGPAAGAIIYDDTVTTPTADPIIEYIEFDTDQTEPDGGVATVANPAVNL